MNRTQGITVRLMMKNALRWTQRVNNIQACAQEIGKNEIIFA